MVENPAGSIENILEKVKTIAVVGLSSNPAKPANYVPRYLKERGYRIIPVNPTIEEALGEKAYDTLSEVPFPVDLVLLFRRSEDVPPFVDEAIRTGAPAVWMQSGIRNDEAAEKARKAGLAVVMDTCMMVEHRRRLFD